MVILPPQFVFELAAFSLARLLSCLPQTRSRDVGLVAVSSNDGANDTFIDQNLGGACQLRCQTISELLFSESCRGSN